MPPPRRKLVQAGLAGGKVHQGGNPQGQLRRGPQPEKQPLQGHSRRRRSRQRIVGNLQHPDEQQRRLVESVAHEGEEQEHAAAKEQERHLADDRL